MNILPTKSVGFCGNDRKLYDINYDQYTWRILSIAETNKGNEIGVGCIKGLTVWEIMRLIKTDSQVSNYYKLCYKIKEHKRKN